MTALVTAAGAEPVDLLERYPTTVTQGDATPQNARTWEFRESDVYRVTGFRLAVGTALRLDVGESDLGIGHCADGAVWAVLMPRGEGTVSSRSGTAPERLRQVWLRFHPGQVGRLFPMDGVFPDGDVRKVPEMRAVAAVKLGGSWHAGDRAMIPEPKDLTVDADTADGVRRFFVVDREAGTAEYISAFEGRAVRSPPPLTESVAAASFDELWEAFDQEYAMFGLRPEVDWAKSRERYRPRALAASSAYEFATVCAEMLRPLRDLHVWMEVAGAPVPVFNRPRVSNANPAARAGLLGPLQRAGRSVEWAKTADRIGYVVVHQWNDDAIPEQVDEVLEAMRDTRGLIVDVRLNGGGSEPLAQAVAGRFLEREAVYAFSRYRSGPGHGALTEKLSRKVSPRGPWRYPRPVIVLIGQKCMSSNESFVAMMAAAAQVTTMGDRTCGSSGNPRLLRLPVGVTVSLPRWIDYLPDGTPLDERGVQPQVPFVPSEGAFAGERDDLLRAALERLRQVPLPEAPIEGPAVAVVGDTSAAEGEPRQPLRDHAAAVRAEAEDRGRPHVVAVFPADGAEEVEPKTELRVRFDRPMDPWSTQWGWESGGFLSCDAPRYDAAKHEFAVSVRLVAGASHRVVLNRPMLGHDLRQSRELFSREGFLSTDQHPAALWVWRFKTRAPAEVAPTKPVPNLVWMSPASGAEVSLLCLVEVEFDEPMLGPEEAPPFVVRNPEFEQPALIGRVALEAERRRFRLPLVLPPGRSTTVKLLGFRSVAGVAAAPIQMSYRSTREPLAAAVRERIREAGEDPRLVRLLESMKARRGQMTSLVERVQTMLMHREKGAFQRLSTTSAGFWWRSPGLVRADAAGPMSTCAAFGVGCDGREAWWHYAGQGKTNLTVCPAAEIERKNVSIADPFGLLERGVAESVAEFGLQYGGTMTVGGRLRHRVEAWRVQAIGERMSHGSLREWQIDAETLRAAEVVEYGDNMVYRLRWVSEEVNGEIPDEAFAVPVVPGVSSQPPEALDADYVRRFINVRDGADGRMSVRWGKQGPKGTSSSGLN